MISRNVPAVRRLSALAAGAGALAVATGLSAPSAVADAPTTAAAAVRGTGCTAPPKPPDVFIPSLAFVRGADGRFTTINPPGACTGKAFGINDRGLVIGGYRTGGYLVGEGTVRSYRWDRGRLTLLRVPGADGPGVEANVADINDRGQMIAQGADSAGTFRSFLRDTNGRITAIAHPKAAGASPVGSGTSIAQINDRGDIVGSYVSGGTIHGFVRDRRGHYSTIDRPGAAATFTSGINDRGKVVGASSDVGPLELFNAPQGFLLDGRGYTAVAFPGAAVTGVQAVNDRTQLVGTYAEADGTRHGFLFDGRRYRTIDHPDAMTGTNLTDINDRGQITGLQEFRPGASPTARQQTRHGRPLLLTGLGHSS